MSSECTCIALRTAARKLTALYDAALAPVGITVAQYSLLRKVERAADPSLTELARLSDLDRSTVGRNVRLLEKMGLVLLEPGEDHREATVRLTPDGMDRLAACRPHWAQAQAVVEARLGADTVHALRKAADTL